LDSAATSGVAHAGAEVLAVNALMSFDEQNRHWLRGTPYRS
jgi:hypothetical protein